MRSITANQLQSYIDKEVRIVYIGPHSVSADGKIIQVDHLITPPVKLLKFIPPSTTEIQRVDGIINTINFYEVWDPNAVKPIITI